MLLPNHWLEHPLRKDSSNCSQVRPPGHTSVPGSSFLGHPAGVQSHRYGNTGGERSPVTSCPICPAWPHLQKLRGGRSVWKSAAHAGGAQTGQSSGCTHPKRQ